MSSHPWSELAQVVATATSAFAATNLDDILLLLLLFSTAATGRNAWQVVAGQYLGFGLLIAASMVGFVGGQLVPSAWIGTLGLLPISLGVSQIIDNLGKTIEGESPTPAASSSVLNIWQRLGLPCGQVAAAAGITVANGGDNIGLYLPLFARCDIPQLVVTLLVFALLVALWCAAAWRLLQTPAVAAMVQRFAQPIAPAVLIGLGLLILIDGHTLADRTLAVLVLTGLLAMALSLSRQLQQVVDNWRAPSLNYPTISSR